MMENLQCICFSGSDTPHNVDLTIILFNLKKLLKILKHTLFYIGVLDYKKKYGEINV